MSILTYLHLRDSVMDTYLKVLDYQNEDITRSDSEKLTIHSHMEQELLQRIEALQKVISGLSGDRAAAGGIAAEAAGVADDWHCGGGGRGWAAGGAAPLPHD